VENLVIGRGNVPVPILVIRKVASIVEKKDILQKTVPIEEQVAVTEIVTFVIEIEIVIVIVTFVMIVSIGIAIVMNVTHPEVTMTIRVLRAEMNMGVATVVTMVMAELVPDLLLDMEDHLPLLVLHHALSTVAHIPQVRIAVEVEVLFVTPGITEGHRVHHDPEVLLFALNLVLMVRMLSPLEVVMDDIRALMACIVTWTCIATGSTND